MLMLEEAAERTWATVEHARAEEALRESEERFRLMADTAPQPFGSPTPKDASNSSTDGGPTTAASRTSPRRPPRCPYASSTPRMHRRSWRPSVRRDGRA